MRRCFALLLLLLASCASSRQITADYSDYQRYRSTRLARSLEERLGASHEYLKAADGAWRADVKRWFVPAEKAYVKRAWHSLPHLRAYLEAMPDGPHAAEVRDRISELRTAQQFANRRSRRELESARSALAKLETAADSRKRFMQELSSWLSALAAIRTWRVPTSELDHEFIYRFRLSEPRGRCEGDRCIKSLSFRYQIPDQKQLSLREALFDVELKLEHSLLVGARIAGPDLFSRLGEASELRPVRPDDEQARAEAIARAIQILESSVEPHLPAQTCEKEAIAPVVLVRACQGMRLTMLAATSAGEEDRIEIVPEP